MTTTNNPNSECPHCKSTNTVRLGRILDKWMHFCFACGKRFELEIENDRDVSN